MTAVRIRCAQCDSLVEMIESWHDPASNAHCLRVFCHGDQETMEFDEHFILDTEALEQIKHQEGIAFAIPRVAPALASGKEKP